VEKLSQRQIAEKLGISKTTVNEIVKRRRAEQAERDERRERAGAKIGREA
jgi:transcriptional regulator with XRE-family HTH domain